MGKGSFLLVLIGFGAPFLGAMDRETKKTRAIPPQEPTGRPTHGSRPLIRAGRELTGAGAGGQGTSTPVASRLWRSAMERNHPGLSARPRDSQPSRPSVPVQPKPSASHPQTLLPVSAWDSLRLRPAPTPERVSEPKLPTSTSMIPLVGSPSAVTRRESADRQEVETAVFLPSGEGWVDLGQRPAPEGAAPPTFRVALKEVGPTVTLFNSGSAPLTLAWEDPVGAAVSLVLAASWPPAPGSLLRPWDPLETRSLASQQGLRVRPGLGEGPITLVVSSGSEEVYAHVVLQGLG